MIAQGDQVTNVVNGTVVNRAMQASLREGRIMLQSEGAEIYLRKVELHPSPRPPGLGGGDSVAPGSLVRS